MKHFWQRPLVISAIFTSALFTGCATLIQERAYVNDTLSRDAITTQSSQPESESLAPDVRKLYAARLASARSAQPAAAFRNPDAIKRGAEPLSDIETRAMMDVVVEFQWDEDDLVPAYRLIMTPYRNIEPQDVEAWSPLAVITLKRSRWTSAMMVAPLPAAGQRLINGQIVTPWTFCEFCFESGNDGVRLPENRRKVQYRILRSNFLQDVESPHLGFAANMGIEKLRFLKAAPHRSIGDAVLVTGAAAVQSARKAFVSQSEARDQRLNIVSTHNRNYRRFLDEKYGPTHLAAYFTNGGPDCDDDDDYSSTPNINQGADYNQRLIDQNYAFIDCAQRVLQAYDIARYTEVYPDLVKREQMLWERTTGAKREKILSPEAMVDWGQGHIERAYAGIERMQARIDGLNARHAREQSQNNAMSALLASMNQAIATQKAENQNRQREIDRLQAQARRPRPTTTPRRYTPSGSRNQQQAQQVSVQAANDPRVSGGVPEESGGSGGDTQQSAAAGDLARTGESDQTPPQPPVSAVAASSQPEKIGTESISGGENGCVALVEANRYPGKSALSSCSYDEPERKSLELEFHNSCGVPVNVSIDLLIDDGTTNTSGEYNIKPGRTRTTVGHCGATRYAFSYEETAESARNRSQ